MHRLFLVAGLALALAGCSVLHLESARPAPVRRGGFEVLAVSDDPYERGLQVGRAYAETLRRVVPIALALADQITANSLLDDPDALQRAEDAVLLAQACWPADQRREIRGLADGAGLREADLLRYNTLPATRPEWQTLAVAAAWGHPLTPHVARMAGGCAEPAAALAGLWHPVVLCRTASLAGGSPAVQPLGLYDRAPGRQVEARQVGMVWPLWVLNRLGVFATGGAVPTLSRPGDGLWPMQWLAADAPDATSAADLMLRLRRRAASLPADLLFADRGGGYTRLELDREAAQETPRAAGERALVIAGQFTDARLAERHLAAPAALEARAAAMRAALAGEAAPTASELLALLVGPAAPPPITAVVADFFTGSLLVQPGRSAMPVTVYLSLARPMLDRAAP